MSDGPAAAESVGWPLRRRGGRFSLRRRVGWWLLPPLVILMAINAVLSYRAALVAVNQAYDRSLSASIRAIAERTHSLEGEIAVDIPYAAFEMFEENAQERIFHAIVHPSGATVTGYPDLRPPIPPQTEGVIRIVDAEYRGEPVRLGALLKRLYDPALVGDDTVMIVFAETTGARTALATELFLDNLRRQLLLIGFGVVLVLLALGSAFKPLLQLRDTIRARREEDLTPVVADNIPSEVAPLIDAINHHMERLSALLVARRRFLADAAHQIRTPLAVLTTQAEVGQRQASVEEMRATFASLLTTIRATRRLANQMLTMSRAEAVDGHMMERGPLELGLLVREVAIDLAPLALKRDVDLAFEGIERPVMLLGNGPMLREMIANLIDNAIRYSPSGGTVLVALAAWRDEAIVSISDQGPGIPQAERENVFKRFYRILGQGDTDGSGLGLAIVREICWAHGGRITLKDGEGGVGLCVEVELPLRGDDAAAGRATQGAALPGRPD